MAKKNSTSSNRDRIASATHYSACRTWGHAWEPTTVDRVGAVYRQGLRCIRCATERTQRVDARTGARAGNSYAYPSGYTLIGGGVLTQSERAALRLAEVKGHYIEPRKRQDNN